MSLKNTSDRVVGVIGAGSFGSAIANILSAKSKVLIYTRDEEKAEVIRTTKESKGHVFNDNVAPTTDLEYLANTCEIIFPIVASSGFRDMMQNLSPFLHPYHILIHGTKGLDYKMPFADNVDFSFSRENVHTMSEVIKDESVVVRVGCLAGPNLAREMADEQPAATVVASHFDEVIKVGQQLLRNNRFQVYGNNDLIGIELAGVLKNIIAIASGALSGLGLGENAKGLLISRGMVEMIYLGEALGGNMKAFVGLAGIGDLVATCNSPLSRNFSVGFRLAKGETLDQILGSMEEVAEGINTVKIAKKLAEFHNVKAPITQTLYKVLYENLTVEEGLAYLMKYPFNVDIAFI